MANEANKQPGNKGGRPKGSPNKATARVREAIAKLAENNVDKMQGWLDQIAQDEKQGPAVAYRLLADMLEYHIPKLARTEHVGDGGGPVVIAATPQDERL